MLQTMACVRSVAGVAAVADHTNVTRLSPFSSTSSSFHLYPQFRLGFGTRRCRLPKSVVVSRKSSGGSSGASFGERSDNADDFLEASFLLSETLMHYRMRKQGFQEPRTWNLSSGWLPFSLQGKAPRPDMVLTWQNLISRYQGPTIFLKISCDGDYLLPIIVGDYAIEKLVDGLRRDESEDCPDQFQFTRNLVEKLGYEVRMVRITKRVVNTYYSRLYFTQQGNTQIMSVDARPSDAINLAIRCKAPVYVSRQIILRDAIRIGYRMGKLHNVKCTYDVLLDSAADGPDLVAEELALVKNMNLAVTEERYDDAAIWRDKLMKLRKSGHEK